MSPMITARALRQAFERENKNSDKPYNVTVSAGAVRIDPEEEMTLEEALAKADQKLYIAKQHRRKGMTGVKEWQKR